MNRANRQEGSVVIVTGGAAGLGLAISRRFLEEGAQVIALDVVEAALTEAVEAVDAEHRARFETLRCDVGDRAEVNAVFGEILDRHGRLDVLVNNAGVSGVSYVVDMEESEWDRVMRVNAKGTFLCCQAVLPTMLERRSGSIVNISSQAGRRGFEQIAHYCAAKGAVLNFSRALALEAAPHVRVNSVCPGTIATPMVLGTLEKQAKLSAGATPGQLMQETIDAIPLKRLQEPEDIAAAVAFLASDDAKEMTGQALDVSGGVLML
jgi:NAD(P)-dependent dehydrogenase (short-subunit alcohol dehydrogenase family)